MVYAMGFAKEAVGLRTKFHIKIHEIYSIGAKVKCTPKGLEPWTNLEGVHLLPPTVHHRLCFFL